MERSAAFAGTQSGPLVSIVTPAYNSEAHLRECIESVIGQTYSNWNYTIINNCSTDRTLDIATEYATKCSRIRVVTNEEFVPIVKNHNVAVRCLSPDAAYCKIVASDDIIFPNCLSELVRVAEDHPTVAIVGSYAVNGASPHWFGLQYPSTFTSGRDICRSRLLGGPYVFGTPTSVLYRADIVRFREEFFNEENLHCDSEVCLEFLRDRDFGFVHQILSFERKREGSTWAKGQRMQTLLPAMLRELLVYGSTYLSPEELAERVRLQLWSYDRSLAYELFRRRDREFWEFHRQARLRMGYPISTLRLARSVLGLAKEAIGSPKCIR